MSASAPTRGDKVTIALGLVTLPLQVFNGVDENATKIARNQYTPAGNRTAQKVFDSETDKEVARSELVMKYTTSDGTAVELTDDEVAAAMGVENGESEVVGIFPSSEFRKYSPAGPAQVRPQTAKIGTKTTRPYDEVYSLIFTRLAAQDRFMLIRFVTRGKPKLLAIFGDGSAQFIHWSNEVREPAPLPEAKELDAKKVALVDTLLSQYSHDEAPLPMDNESVEAVRTYAELKAKGEQPTAKPAEKVTTADDLMAMLEASLTVNA